MNKESVYSYIYILIVGVLMIISPNLETLLIQGFIGVMLMMNNKGV